MPLPNNEEIQSDPSPFGDPGKPTNSQFDDRETFIRQTFEQDPLAGFELLFRRYYQPLYSHATRILYSPDVAGDVVSEVFLNFWQKEIYLKVTSSYRLYLLTSVRYAALAHLRREFKHESLDDSEAQKLAFQSPSAENTILFDELYLAIQQGVKSLPPKGQRVFMLSRFEGKSHAEIAEELSISYKTVEVHIYRALRVLRNIIDDL